MDTTTFSINQTLNAENQSIIFKIELTGIKELLIYNDSVSNDVAYKEYKISSDNETYSYWKEFNISDINKFLVGEFKDIPCYLKIRYTLEDTNIPISINNITIEYEAYINNLITYTPEIPESTIVIQPPQFDVYQNTSIAASLHQKLSHSANTYLGLPALYFKSDVVNTDTFLHEHTLLELADSCGKQIKIMFDGNEMPEKPMITPMGTTFEMPKEAHIDFSYFYEFFGDHVPSSGDIIFIPITHAIWQVNGSDLVRGIMNAPVYWKLTLVKYQQELRREETALKHDSIIGTLQENGYDVMTAEDTFGDDWKKDAEKVVKPRETRIDGVKKWQDGDMVINQNMKIDNTDIENNFIIISHHQYNFESILEDEIALQYNIAHATSTDISFSAWVQLYEYNSPYSFLVKVENNTIYSSKFVPYTIATPKYLFNKQGELFNVTITGNIIQDTLPDGLYYIREDKLVNIYNDWYILNNEFIINETLGIRKPINFTIETTWYNIIITESARFNEIGIYIYELAPNTDELNNKLSITVTADLSNVTFENIIIKTGLHKITNIRVFDEMLQISDHNIVLNQQLINDSHKAIVSDIAKDNVKAEYGRPL